MITYNLVPERDNQDLSLILKKIADYLITFTGDIKATIEPGNKLRIVYSDTSYDASCDVVDNKIKLSIHEDDSITVNLLKNISNNSGFRIKNAKGYFLPNDSRLLEVASTGIKKEVWEILKTIGLTPLFQYRDSLIFFCTDETSAVYLVNRHYLEFLLKEKNIKIDKKEISTKVSDDIPTFIALFDRGLISLIFPKYQNNDIKVTNLSGFDIEKLKLFSSEKNDEDILLQVTNFRLDKDKQNFIQESTTEKIDNQNYLALKINQDYNYKTLDKKVFKVLNVSVFYN